MSVTLAPPTARDLQRWFPQRFGEIAANKSVVQTFTDFIERGPANLLVTGPSRSGKTRTIKLGIRALCCPNRTITLDPCGQCATCHDVGEVRDGHHGIYAVMMGSERSYITINCETVSKDELLALGRDTVLWDPRTLVYFDEFRALAERNFAGLILTLIDESNATFFASAITTKSTIWTGRKSRIEGVPEPLLARFMLKGTTLPNPAELANWMHDRSRDWEIEIVEPDVTIPTILRRTQHRVGYVLHFFAAAATTKARLLTPNMATSVNLTAAD